jgi:5-methylcytosine-specific restriction endonuclease McrA
MNHQRVPTEERSPALKFYYANLEANRAKSREKAKARYYANKQEKLLRNAKYRKDNPEKWRLIKEVSNKKYNKRRFFFMRAAHHAIRVNDSDEAIELCAVLSRAWYTQRGRCAYTGVKLDRTAQVDHKIPVSRGGTNHASNLHWVTPDANWVKRDRTHSEFIAICTDIAAYIEANKMPRSRPAAKAQ